MGNNNQKFDEKYSVDLFNSIVFNHNDFKEEKGNKNFEVHKDKINDIIFESGTPFNFNNSNIEEKNFQFNLFCQTLHKKIGIIILFNEKKKNTLKKIKKLLSKIEDINDLEIYESIQKYFFIYLLDESQNEIFDKILSYIKQDKNNLPFILFVKKDNKNQDFNVNCIKFYISNLEDVNLFKNILLNFINQKKDEEIK